MDDVYFGYTKTKNQISGKKKKETKNDRFIAYNVNGYEMSVICFTPVNIKIAMAIYHFIYTFSHLFCFSVLYVSLVRRSRHPCFASVSSTLAK